MAGARGRHLQLCVSIPVSDSAISSVPVPSSSPTTDYSVISSANLAVPVPAHSVIPPAVPSVLVPIHSTSPMSTGYSVISSVNFVIPTASVSVTSPTTSITPCIETT